ncbi:ESPR-type extended signal peptide-containing protein [Acidaminococcus fermentans]|uniref:ESPR-type extended signal peptide-containing protein n=1 Tax=Acidaminococcus fermentans TaxID=905 RepID=UPI003F8AFCF5
MNRIFKVIFNRNRQLVQVVPEYAKNRGKEVSESRKGGVRGLAKVLLTFLATLMIASPGYAADETGSTGSGSIGTSTATATVSQVVIQAGNSITVGEPVTDTEKNTITYTISANGDGTITDGNTGLVTGGKVYTAINNGIQTTIGSLSTNGNYIRTGNSVSGNLVALDTQVKSNADNITKNANDISTETTARETADNSLSNKIGTLDANGNYIKKDASVSANLSSLDTQVKSNTTDITGLKDLSNITSAGETGIRKQAKKAVQVTATGNATVTTNGSKDDGNTLTYTIIVAHNGEIKAGDTNLVSGGTLYTELRPSNGIYVNSVNTTAANLLALDTNLKNVIDAIGLDADDTTKSYTSKLNKYFKVNPTGTAVTDAAANGTNAVAIGPSAQAGDKSTDATTSTTTITGGTSSTAIGDNAKANGNQSVALGYGSEVLNTTDQSGKTTATISGSTAIGNGAKVNGATDAAAVGTSAQVNETATGGIAFGKNAVTGEDKGTVTVGDVTANVAAVGGENSVALGTSAKASGNTALALGKGAQVNNYTTQSGTTVTKTVNSGSTAIGSGAVVTGANDAVAFGSGAKVEGTGTNADDSLALGKSASVATAKDAMALGTSASVASGADNAIALGNGAKANTTNATAIGYNASATGAGAVAIGENTSTSTEGGISIGSGTSVSGKSIVIGYATDNAGNAVKTESNNTDAVAIGNGAQANANDSISIGHQAGKDTAEGRTSGYGSLIAIGTNAGNNVKGMQNVALGSGAGSNVKSSYNVAIGSNAGSGINYAAAADSNPQNGYNISIGYEANYQSADANAKNIKESIAIGHSANAVSEATALGTGAAASGDKSMALGYNATAADTDSIALGDNASAGGGNIAIGSGSQAPAVASYDKGYLTGSTSVNGYISVGGTTSATGTTVLRRISNVADGAADQDAVTVAQLKQAYTNLEGTIKTTDNKITDTYTQSAIDSKISTVERKITASQTKYFSINPSSDTLTANVNNDGASTTGAADAMAIGPNATATSAKAVAIGNNVSASGKGSIALGTADNPATSTTVAAGGNTSANPHVTSAEGVNSVAIGTSAIAQTDNSVAFGTRASVYTSDMTDKTTGTTMKVGQQSIAIGYQAETRNSNATSIGSDAKAYSNGSTAIGHGAYAQGTDSAVIGTFSTANGASSGILGKNNTINGSNTYAVGSENNVNGNWGAVTYSGLYGSKNIVNPVSDTSGNTKHGMDSLFITGNSNTIGQGSYSDTVQNISILGNSNSVTGASGDEANAGTTANITVIGGSNTVTGRDGSGSDDMGKTWNQLTRTTVIGYGNTVNQATATTSLADTQILGNDVTATLGNSVYLGTGSAAKNANVADVATLTDAEKAAVDALDTTGMTDTEKAAAQAKAKAAARYVTNLAVMKKSGTTAGLQSLSTDTTYDDGTRYTYAGSNPTGVITVGKAGSERRIQNVAAGLVSATSTDAVNGSQLYALTRQLRFGGDNSSFGTTTADDQNVVARGSNETLNIIGGEKDTTKLTDNNIGVLADSTNNTLTVKLASNLKDLNTAQLGSGSGDSYKETIKLDGTGTTGGQMTLAGADGTVKTTLDTTGLTIANGPKFTSSGIDAASQKINHVTAGTDDADAANVGQVNAAAAEATTEVEAGTNASLGTVKTSAADKHKIYTVNVDNLAVKANGTGTTTVALANGINFKNGTNTTSAVDASGNVTIDTKNLTLKANGGTPAAVTMDGGINFKDGTNTTATVDTDGTVKISATHNKLSTASAAPTGTNDDVTLTLTDADGNTVTSTGLKNTYTTVTKDGTAHTVTFARNDGITQTLSLGDLDGASKGELATTAAKATSEVTKGTNVTSVTKTTGNNGQNIYTVNVDDLAVKTTSGEKKSVHLADGLVFADGTNTTATVGDNGTIKFNVSEAAIKKQAVQAISVTGGSNVTVTPETNADGTLKTFTVAASDLKYSANGTNKTTSLANGISFASGTNTTAEIDNQGAIKINATHNKLDATGAATTATADSNAVTLTLEDADGNKTTTALTDTYTTISKDGANKKVTFKRNDGETQTIELSDLGGITAAQDKYITGGTVSYDTNGNGTAALTGTNGITASITGLKDTKVSSGTVNYVGTQGNASGSATLTMNDGSKVAITGLKDDYITSAAVGAETNHVTMTRLGGGTVDLDLNPILGKYSLSDYRLVGNGDTQDQAYQVSADGTVTLNVVDSKNAANKKTIQITGLASQSGVNAGRTTVKSSDNSVTVSDSTANSDTHTYDIKVDYSKIPANLTVKYSGDNGTSGSNTMNQPTAFSGTANQIVTTAENGKVSFKLADNISGIQSVTTGDAKLNTDGLTITGGPSVLKTGINAGGKIISNVANAEVDTDAATLQQVKKARTKVAAGDNVKEVTSSEATDGSHQMAYTVNVDNLSVKANKEAAKSVTLKNGLTFNDGTNTTASVGDNGEVKYDLNSTLTGLTSVTAGNSTLDTNGLTIKEGTAPKVVITSGNVTMGGNVIHNVGDGVAPTDAVNKGQLDALQSQVSGGWNLSGKNSDGTAVTAQIGAGKMVTYADGTYTKSVVTKDDSTGNATVKVDVTTGTFGSGTGDKAGTVTSTTTGLATTQDVANAINSASINVVADNTSNNAKPVKAGDTIHFAKDKNLTLTQNGTTFTYGLNPEISISKVTTSDATNGSTVQDAKGITTTDAAGNTYIQNGQGITLTSSDKTKSPVKLTNTGLNNGGNKITDVADGELTEGSKEAVNGGQLYELKQKVGSGWKLTGDDTTQATNIGAGAQVSVKSGNFAKVTVNKSDSGATIQYDVQTQEITTNGGKAKTAQDGVATTQDVVNAINDSYWTVTSGQTGNGKATGTAVSNVTAGTAVTLQAGDNLLLNQAGNSFTYALNPVVTGMTSISFTGMGTGNDGKKVNDLVIGLQNGGGANTNKGYFITGLSNTEWNQSNYQGDRAATEAQLKKAIENVSIVKGGGGYGLTADEGANNGGDKNVTQALGSTIAVRGDGTYDENGNLVKTGNVKTVAYTDAAGSGQTGAIQIQLNKDIDLGTDGSLQAGGVTLQNNSVTVGTNGVVISSSGSERTVSNLSNIHWDAAKVSQDVSAGGYKNSGKAATEGQLAEAISTATSTAAQNEQHIRNGEYSVQTINNADGSKSQGVSIDIITGDGSKPEAVKGHVVIKDVAKASDVGDVSKLHDTLKNPDGTKNVTGAINNLDNRVTGLDTRMNDIYTTAGQHSSVSSESNIVVDHSAKNESGGTDYKLSLNREKIDLDKVTIEGKSGAVTAKTVTAEEYKVGNKTYISSDGLNANSQKITNVQAGTADTDAANVGQVREADEQLAGGIAQNARNISQLGREVDKLDSRIDRVGAGAAALAALHPGAYDPNDKVDFSAGYGNYRGASAAAVGMYYHPDERTILSMGVAMGGGENMVNAGVTWKLGRRTPAAPQPVPVKAAPGAPALVPVSTAAAAPVRPVETAPAVRPVAVRTSVRPVETVALVAPAARVRPVQPAVAPVRTADTNAQLMELLARQTAILEKLSEQKAVPAAAPAASGDELFTDVPENHWAYECALKMEKAGVLKGLGGLQVEGNPLLTRKDFARILYTALKNGATTNPALNSDNSLNRMASEFRGELKMVKG